MLQKQWCPTTYCKSRSSAHRQCYWIGRYSTKKNFVCLLITNRNCSCGKVMFSQACVTNSVHGEGVCIPATTGQGVCVSQHALGRECGRHPLDRHLPLDGHCSGRYASYCNAFLFYLCKFEWVSMVVFIYHKNRCSHETLPSVELNNHGDHQSQWSA